MKRFLWIWLMVFSVSAANADFGDTTVAMWRNNTRGAFTMSFDDSLQTHASIAMPAIIERGLVGTWFINPGKSRHRKNRKVWEIDGPKSGQEYANHTWVHRGAGNYREADFQIGETARYIWGLRAPGASKLQAFSRGGATTWNITEKQLKELMEKYHCMTRSSELSARTDMGVDGDRLVAKAREAITEGRWVAIHFHGIGAEWLSIDTASFFQLVDYLADNKDELWSAGWSAAHQYLSERDHAQINVLERSEARIRIRVTTGLNPERYAEPLTLVTRVPAGWSSVTVTQDGRSRTYQAAKGQLQYEAIPDRGEIVLQAVVR
jgi:hypothetical protein